MTHGGHHSRACEHPCLHRASLQCTVLYPDSDGTWPRPTQVQQGHTHAGQHHPAGGPSTVPCLVFIMY